MFILIGVILFFLAIFSILTKNKWEKVAKIIAVSLLIMSAIRYSIGNDYFSYAYIYSNMPLTFREALESTIHGELGFKLLIVFFKKINFDYTVFVVCSSVITNLLFFIPMFSKSQYPLVSLSIYYYIYYFVYTNSGIRQGLSMAIIFYAITMLSLDKNKLKIILLIILASLFHVPSLIMLVIIPLNKLLKDDYLKVTNTSAIIWFLLILLAVFLNLSGYNIVLLSNLSILQRFSLYLDNSVSILSVVSKSILLFLVTYLYYSGGKKIDKKTTIFYSLYLIGSIIYFVFSNITIVARILDYFTMFEMIMISNLLSQIPKFKKRTFNFLAYSLALIVLFGKDQQSFTLQERYYNPGIFEYKYFHIFDKEKIRQEKPYSKMELLLPEKY